MADRRWLSGSSVSTGSSPRVFRNLSLTGMFIQTERPQRTGSKFELILQLGDDFKLVQGRAQVVWTRAKAEGRDPPPGMGIRFLSLDRTSEGVLRRLIGEHTLAEMPRELALGPPVTAPLKPRAEPTRPTTAEQLAGR